MPAYVIAQINVKHKEGFRAYAEKVPQTIKNFGGKYLVRAGDFQIKEGIWDFSRNVIIEFPSFDCLFFSNLSPTNKNKSDRINCLHNLVFSDLSDNIYYRRCYYE